jgi:23S rRNA (uracil1939-C5)-methyltransferase
MSGCKYAGRCGGCVHAGKTNEEQLAVKKKELEALLLGICPVAEVIGMENPYHYRNKVHAVFGRDKKGQVICGTYEAGTHRIVDIEECQIEDKICQEIIRDIKKIAIRYHMKIYDEDRQTGFLRHVLLRRGFTSGEVMVVLVCADLQFVEGKSFVRLLRSKHPEITTIILNENNAKTTFVLGKKEKVLFGKGYITDKLCGNDFRISSGSFYQINPVQTEKLYKKAVELAGLTGKERVLDAYCGIGTIAITASAKAAEVIGVELNEGAVRDATENARINHIKNVRFIADDAGRFMKQMSAKKEKCDVVFMDPPRSGSTEEFMNSVAVLSPKRIVYVSCGPDTLARDLKYFRKKGYAAECAYGFDLFPFTEWCESVVLLQKR